MKQDSSSGKSVSGDKKKKKRQHKYDQKLHINGTFDDLLKELATPKRTNKKESII